jgi:death on curing protein
VSEAPTFLSPEQLVALHDALVERYGGLSGLRDAPGLASAVGAPQASFGGAFLHEDLAHMAAAYAFHVAQAQAFLDGNKRAGVGAALVFLELGGVRLPAAEAEGPLYEAMLDLASRVLTKEGLAELFRRLARGATPSEGGAAPEGDSAVDDR